MSYGRKLNFKNYNFYYSLASEPKETQNLPIKKKFIYSLPTYAIILIKSVTQKILCCVWI